MNSIYKCPVCDRQLLLSGKSYVCDNKHTFDIAKEEYVNLLLPNEKSSKEPGDSKEAMFSRRAFLENPNFSALSPLIIVPNRILSAMRIPSTTDNLLIG